MVIVPKVVPGYHDATVLGCMPQDVPNIIEDYFYNNYQHLSGLDLYYSSAYLN